MAPNPARLIERLDMADEGSGQTPPAQTDNGNQAQPQPQQGDFVQVPKSDWEQAQVWKRQSEQVKGMRSLVDAARQNGIEKPEDFSKFGKLRGSVDTLADRGFDDDLLGRLLGSQTDPETDKPLTRRELDDLLSSKLGEIEKTNSTKIAESEHKRLSEDETRMFGSLHNELADELLGPDANAFQKKLLKHALNDLALDYRDPYPEGHPLRERTLRPMNEQDAAKFKKAVMEQRNSLLGEALAATGDAATKQAAKPASTTAGRGKGQGQPDDSAPKKGPLDLPKSEKIRMLQERRNKRGAATAG